MVLTACQFYTRCEVKELPVFTPNEYFFKNHQRPGEERYETYMRVMRDIMAESLNFKLSPLSLEDKFAYKEILYPRKDKKPKKE